MIIANFLTNVLSSFSSYVDFNVKYRRIVEIILQKLANGLVSLEAWLLINVNKLTTSAITTGIFATITDVAIFIKGFFLSFPIKYAIADKATTERTGARTPFITDRTLFTELLKKEPTVEYKLE